MSDLLILFVTFFKIGLFTIGGGYAMIPLITQEVIHKGWMTLEELVDFIAIAESTPGPFAVNVTTFVGVGVAGLAGAITATTAIVAPPMIIIILIAKNYDRFKKSRYVAGALSGIRPAVIGLIAGAALSICVTSLNLDISADLTEAVDIRALICFILIVGIAAIKKLNAMLVILLAAVLGVVIFGVI